MLFNKILTLTLAVTVGLQPLTSQAVNLGDAFQSLTGSGSAMSTNEAGRYTSAARTGFTAGGFDLRVPRAGNAPQLLSVTPPRVTAGCNGISAHFGGFSFISGAEFGQLLKQIASGAALGFVSSLVMKTLCPACEAVVQELKTAAQQASRLAKDSCQVGQTFAEDFKKSLGATGDAISVCAENSSQLTGAEADSLSAYQKTCNTLWKAKQFLSDNISKTDANGNKLKEEDKQAALMCSNVGYGNKTWYRLSEMDKKGVGASLDNEANVRKLMLINIMGADMESADNATPVGCDTGNGSTWTASPNTEGGDANYCKPATDLKALTGFFMCGAALSGTGTTKISKKVISYCKAMQTAPSDGSQETKLWTCRTGKGGQADFANCPYLELVPASQVVQGEGFLIQVNNLLREGVDRVRSGKSFYSTDGDDKGKRVIALVNAAPYPLYQVINAAAVYPAAADELIDSMSILVAEQFAYAMFDEMMRLDGRSSNNRCVTRDQATQMLDFVNQLRSQAEKNLSLIAQQFSVQQGISEQIRQVNMAIQRQVMSQDLLATGKMTEALNKAITGTGAGAGTAAPASATE